MTLKVGQQLFVIFTAPPNLAKRAGGDFIKAKTALSIVFQQKLEIQKGLAAFGLKVSEVIPMDKLPQVTIHFAVVRNSDRSEKDVTGFFGGVWSDLIKAVMADPRPLHDATSVKPWWKFW